jgi:fibronectin type 3 domain-containing protein
LTGEANSFKLIAETSALAFDDPDFVFGQSYFYRVSAIVKARGSTATSDDSEVVEIVARDTFPPQAPRGLTALYTTDAVELIWNASSEADLGGYFVYRREGQLSESKLTSEPLSTPIFRDANVSAGKHYTYRVTAVDSTGNESVFSDEAAAEAP